MKKRIVKKYVNRYIKPLVKDLPKVDGFSIEKGFIVGGQEMITIYQNNHTIRNGKITTPGVAQKTSLDFRKNLIATAMKAQEIINTHEHVYFRLFEIRANHQVRLRLITE